MRTRTEIKNHLLTEFKNAPSSLVESQKAATNRQLVILNAQLAVLIEIALDFREIIIVEPELREQFKERQ